MPAKGDFNILFTCAGRRVSLMNSFRRALAELGLRGSLFATDITTSSPAYQTADRGFLVPPTRRVEYMPSLLEIAERNAVSLVVPLTDLDLRPLSRHAARFRQFGCEVMVGSDDVVLNCRDKRKTHAMIEGAGLASIITLTLEEFRDNPFYPCFIKPVMGSASFGAAIIRTPRELDAHVATFGDIMLVQEYVPGQEYTVDVYRSRSGDIRRIVPRQRLVVRSGEVEKAITVKDAQLIEATARLAGRLDGLWGVFCCQCRREPGQPPRFFEINPRFGGGAPLSIAAGANLPLYVIQEVLGLPGDDGPVDGFVENMLMLRYEEACFSRVDDPTSLPGYNSPIFR
ncbi:MAG: ATP-grasp domain-containing protein [Planctomycetota bacterium]|nr:ATP-grasp domain-containing protein [Planctomycetota bacterium]